MTVIDLHTFAVASQSESTVLCLGNFDGIHVGHRALVSRTLEQKELLKSEYTNIKCGAWFFKRAPLDVILGRQTPLLTDLEQKLEIFAELGLDYAFIYEYGEVGHLSPEAFVNDVLKKECNCVFAVCGYNFKFGAGASGNSSTLAELMNQNVSIVGCVELDGQKISSSEIRRLISEGKITEANSLLGRNFSIHGTVIQGKQLGRKLGIPTINQKIPTDSAVLKKGIYISRTLADGKWMPSVSNIGVRPSVEATSEINCETHIISFSGDLYSKDVKVEFIERLRDELKFESIDSLKAQIENDIKHTVAYFSRNKEA